MSLLKNTFFSKNNKCSCLKYTNIENNNDLEERIKKTSKIVKNLRLLDVLNNLGTRLYKCEICSQMWQENFSWMHGNLRYVFKVPKIELKDWKEEPFIGPNQIFMFTGKLNMYFERGTFEEKEEKCKKANCENQAIKLSVFCIIHQMENVGISIELPTGYRWFPPYEKEKLLVNMELIKKDPNYKVLKQ